VYYSKELTVDARELKGELYCLPCHDKMGVPICGACRRPIEGRVVNAMGKQWHVEVCVFYLDFYNYVQHSDSSSTVCTIFLKIFS